MSKAMFMEQPTRNGQRVLLKTAGHASSVKTEYVLRVRRRDSITSICSAEDVDSDAIRAMVESVCDVYKMRTSTLEKSLSLYQQMLYDVSDDY